MKRNSLLLYTIALATLPALSSAQAFLTASPAATPGSFYGGSIFNFTNNSTSPLQLTGLFDLNLSSNTAGGGGFSGTYQVYTKDTGFVYPESSPVGWSLLGTASVASSNPQLTAGSGGSFTTINVGNSFLVAPGKTIALGVFLTSVGESGNNGGFIGYSAGANTYTDGVATITTGITKSYDPGSTSRDVTNIFAGNGQSFNNRSFSGRVQYAPAPVPEPFTIATLGIGLVGFVARRRRSR